MNGKTMLTNNPELKLLGPNQEVLSKHVQSEHLACLLTYHAAFIHNQHLLFAFIVHYPLLGYTIIG